MLLLLARVQCLPRRMGFAAEILALVRALAAACFCAINSRAVDALRAVSCFMFMDLLSWVGARDRSQRRTRKLSAEANYSMRSLASRSRT